MKEIIFAIGSKENANEDINILAQQFYDPPHNIIVSGSQIKDVVIDIASSLFLEERLVLTLLDPEKEVIEEIKAQLNDLRGRVPVIIYITTGTKPDYAGIEIDGDIMIMERDPEKRLKERASAILKKYGKLMTDKAFEFFRERLRDEAVLETELMKLINYAGDKKKIDSKDTMEITAQTHQDDLIGFFEAFSSKDKKRMLYILDNLINTMNLPSESAIIIIHSFIVRQTRLLLHAKEIENKIGMHTKYPDFTNIFNRWKEALDIKTSERKHYLPFQKNYYAYKLSSISRKFDTKDLLLFLDRLVKIDLGIKTAPEHERRAILEAGLLAF
ncbi:MAG: hypothetical protein KBI10_07240 [Syntrophorhabdales bacterium]|nr:hypothetical protein [Syntrophorhabdales bacterium]